MNELTTRLYQDLEVVFDGDEPLLTQNQIATILGLEVNTVTKAISRALETDEFEGESVCDKLSYTATDGKTYQVNHYTLDVLLWVGYRAHKSAKVIKFRKWVKSLVKEAFNREVAERESLQAALLDEQRERREADYIAFQAKDSALFMLADLRHELPIENVED